MLGYSGVSRPDRCVLDASKTKQFRYGQRLLIETIDEDSDQLRVGSGGREKRPGEKYTFFLPDKNV